MKDLSKMEKAEIIEYLAGKRVVVVNSISGSEEEVVIRSDTKEEPLLVGRVMRCLSPSGWRYINIDNIITVGRKKIA